MEWRGAIHQWNEIVVVDFGVSFVFSISEK